MVLVKTSFGTVIGGFTPEVWENTGNGHWGGKDVGETVFLFRFVGDDIRICENDEYGY